MKTVLTIAVLFAGLAFAADPPAKAPTPGDALKAAEQSARLAKLEGLVLREQLAVEKAMRSIEPQLDRIRAEQQSLYLETCKAAGIEADPKVCAIDLTAKTVAKRDAPSPAKK